MSDLEWFLENCLVVDETLSPSHYNVFLITDGVISEDTGFSGDIESFPLGKKLETQPEEIDSDGSLCSSYRFFSDQEGGMSKEQAEESLAALKESIRRTVRAVKKHHPAFRLEAKHS